MTTLRGDGGNDTDPNAVSLRVIRDQVVMRHALPRVGEVTIGRSHDCDICIDDPSISRRHARLRIGPSIVIEDLGSANGTKIGGRGVSRGAPAEVRDAEVIELGSVVVVVQRGETTSKARTAPLDPLHVGATMQRLVASVVPVANSTLPILLLGETGVGKEVLAEAIHRVSPRAARAFVRINCAAIAPSLVESELFGHERGAFTGAAHAKPGLIETADGGTVFFDEVGELPTALQAKLLQVIEEGRVQRVGALVSRPLDVRFVSATNRDLDSEVAAGRFRADLLYRLNGLSLTIPALRERRDEIEELARHFLSQAAAECGRVAPALSPAAGDALRAHPWPGNVRELRHVIHRAVLMCAGSSIDVEQLRLSPTNAATVPPPLDRSSATLRTDALHAELDRIERDRILDALTRSAGNQTQAAKLLGISRTTLVARLEAFGFPRPRKRT